jgi:CBS domain-containing protein
MKAMLDLYASELMTKVVYTVLPDDTVSGVAKVLAQHDISAAPVCDEGGQLIGMISEGDLMRPFTSSNESHRAWWLTLLAEGTELAPNFLEDIKRAQWHVRNLMSSPVITATEDTTLAQIADLLVSHRIKRVPVLRGNKIVGIISRSDVIRVLASQGRHGIDASSSP